MKKSKFTLRTENELKKMAPAKIKNDKFGRDYIFGGIKNSEQSNQQFLGLSMPTLRNYLAKLEANFEEMQALFFESNYFEVKSLALYWLDKQSDEFLLTKHRELTTWVNIADNWAHADGYCSIMARLFERDQKLMLPVYLEWNKHPRAWHRRCSLVGTFYYSRARKKHPSFSLAERLVTPHFTAPEYYVQKAVGWTMREMYNVYPIETIQFIENNLLNLSSVAWVAASEKLEPKVKTKLLKKRKQNRVKK